MKLRAKLMMFTAAAALTANMAFAAIDPQALADSYIAKGYSYVEVKQGPTQTKLEAVKGDVKVEVIYDNASGEIIKQETGRADDDYIGRTGVEIEDTDSDFDDSDDSDDDEDEDEDEDDDDDDDDNSGQGNDDDDEDDGGDSEDDGGDSEDDSDDDEDDDSDDDSGGDNDDSDDD